MPGYGKRMEKYAPETTDEVDTVEKRFKMPALPKLTIIQLTLIAIVLAYAWSARKMNGVVISTILIASALLHIYDHLYRVKRGEERLFFFPEAKKEGYCGACRK
jgi:L-asparagine transporter-like permease